jgi:hypothetical protein
LITNILIFRIFLSAQVHVTELEWTFLKICTLQIPFYPPQQQFEEFTEEVVLFLASCHSYYSASSNLFQCPLRLCLGLGFNMVFFLHVTVICQVLNLTWIFAIQVCKGIIYDAAGTRDIEIEVKTIKKWSMHAQVAASYFDKYGRIILVGDAAHRFPPAGGFGLNTGVQDAHNLAWKLAAVLKGHCPSALLLTYDTERRPVCTETLI